MQPIDDLTADSDGYGGGSRTLVNRRVRGPDVRVFLRGEIDGDCAGVVEKNLTATVEEPGVRYVVVDFTDLRFMDARCAAVLLGARRRADQRGISMTIAYVSGIPRLVLEALGLYDELLTSRPCPDDGPSIRSKAS